MNFHDLPLDTNICQNRNRKDQIVDEYALKMLRSGYSLSQVRLIIVSGIRSFKRKVAHAKEGSEAAGRACWVGNGSLALYC